MKHLYVVLFMVLLTACGWLAILSQTPMDLNNAHAKKGEPGGSIVSSDDKISTKGISRESLVNFKIKGRIKKIEDGDTIVLIGANKMKFKIRFSDMDTPEIKHKAFTRPCKKIPARLGQPGGQAALSALEELISVKDRVTAECYEVDIYGRPVCHIFKDKMNVNLEMIKNGWGWLPKEENWIRDPMSAELENEAKTQKKGAWGLPNQVSPKIWRKEKWEKEKCDCAAK